MTRNSAVRTLLAMLTGSILLASAGATAAAREDVLGALSKVSPGWTDLGLEAHINGGGNQVVRVGDEIRYVFSAKADAHLTVLHVDSHGVVSVLYPSGAYPGNAVAADLPNSIPAGSDLALEVSPPLGREDVFVFATRTPVTLADLGLPESGLLAVVDVAEAPAFAVRVAELLGGRSAENVAAAHVPLRVVGRGDLDMTKEDILSYFTVQTRALRRPKIDLQIQFDTGSAELDQQARDQLDQMGMALQELEETFVIGGHTDDVGPDDLNTDLSRRRAESVRELPAIDVRHHARAPRGPGPRREPAPRAQPDGGSSRRQPPRRVRADPLAARRWGAAVAEQGGQVRVGETAVRVEAVPDGRGSRRSAGSGAAGPLPTGCGSCPSADGRRLRGRSAPGRRRTPGREASRPGAVRS